MANPNTLYAHHFVEQLIQSGLKHVVFVPGSRHTPLVLAFAHYKDSIKIWSHLDERSASFFALGLAMATDTPVAIICTSGSAGANMFPAIIEAHRSRIPLIVITADRPHELRHSGANQTIDQIKLFGDYVRWFVDAPLPEQNPVDVVLRHIGTLGSRAFQIANGQPKGVVHINMPFRKPFEPEGDEAHIFEHAKKISHGVTRFSTTYPALSETQVQHFIDMLLTYDEGLIICGTRTPRNARQLITRLARKTGFPILADGVSGLRAFDGSNAFIIGAYDTVLMREDIYPKPQIIVRFGDVPVSKWLNDYLSKIRPHVRMHVSADGIWADDQHHTTYFIHANPYTLLHQAFEYRLSEHPDKDITWAQRFIDIEKRIWSTLPNLLDHSEFFDGMVLHDIMEYMPDSSTLFVGNSLPVRHLDQWARPAAKSIEIFANRGASGIDGNVSTALGLGASQPNKPLVGVVGDITCYHDMNGLLAVQRLGIPITLVVLHNDGGGIFHRLPIHEYDPEFTDYFVTPHNLDFSHVAQLYGLGFVRVHDRTAFRDAFTHSIKNTQSTLIEVRTNAQEDLSRRKTIIEALHNMLKSQPL